MKYNTLCGRDVNEHTVRILESGALHRRSPSEELYRGLGGYDDTVGGVKVEEKESGGPGPRLMENRELRALARAKLEGKWGKAAVVVLIFSCLVAVPPMLGRRATELSGTSGARLFLGVIGMVLEMALNYGLFSFFLRLTRDEDPPAGVLFDGFRMFWKVIGVQLWTGLLVALWVLVVVLPGVVAIVLGMFTSVNVYRNPWPYVVTVVTAAAVVGIVVGLRYVLTLYLLHDHPEWNVFHIARTSAAMMRNRRWKYFLLQLSFIGWGILCLLTFGLGSLFLIPYVTTTTAAFYEDLRRFGEPNPATPPGALTVPPAG